MQVIAHTKTNTETKIELIEHNHSWAKYCLTPTTGKQASTPRPFKSFGNSD
jgi:tRNA pseudouridine32 synthase/23S rRNA pseudouridine746 synthase